MRYNSWKGFPKDQLRVVVQLRRLDCRRSNRFKLSRSKFQTALILVTIATCRADCYLFSCIDSTISTFLDTWWYSFHSFQPTKHGFMAWGGGGVCRFELCLQKDFFWGNFFFVRQDCFLLSIGFLFYYFINLMIFHIFT